MSEAAVGRLYDALVAAESPYRRGIAYPVHKRLRLDGAADIYDWIAERVTVPRGGRILDAGCGTGFGCLRLAARGDWHVTGVSLSAGEIAHARRAAADAPEGARVEFRTASFDALPAAAFDLVVAVESLKHSANLERSLASLLASLKPGGQLVIVEDLRNAAPETVGERRLSSAWQLERLYGLEDYVAALVPRECHVVDLTSAVPRASALSIALRRGLVALAGAFAPTRRTALRAFRAGLELEHLYARGVLSYQAILCSTAEGAQ